MRHQLRTSYFWPDWNSDVRLGVFHTIFCTKEVTFYFFFQNLTQILNSQILNICRVLLHARKQSLWDELRRQFHSKHGGNYLFTYAPLAKHIHSPPCSENQPRNTSEPVFYLA